MLTLDSQRTAFNVVISDLTRCKISPEGACDKLSSLGFVYFACVHDKDKDEQGNDKLLHMHLVLHCQKRLRVKQIINQLQDVFNTNFENVRVDEVISSASSIQYLLHINDKNKYQYSRDELLSNNQEQADAYLIETPSSQELTTQQLFDYIFKDNLSKLELCYCIGIGKYQHYRHTINDLYEWKSIKKKQAR